MVGKIAKGKAQVFNLLLSGAVKYMEYLGEIHNVYFVRNGIVYSQFHEDPAKETRGEYITSSRMVSVEKPTHTVQININGILSDP